MSPRASLVLALALVATSASAGEQQKRYLPEVSGQSYPICGAGQALTYTLQCDPGSRPPLARIWNQGAPGVEVCKVTGIRCEPIIGVNQSARAGFEVQDSIGGETVLVTFGVEGLLGDEL